MPSTLWSRALPFAVVLALLVGAFPPWSGQAASSPRPRQTIVTVNALGDGASACPATCTLRGAIAVAGSGDTI